MQPIFVAVPNRVNDGDSRLGLKRAVRRCACGCATCVNDGDSRLGLKHDRILNVRWYPASVNDGDSRLGLKQIGDAKGGIASDALMMVTPGWD